MSRSRGRRGVMLIVNVYKTMSLILLVVFMIEVMSWPMLARRSNKMMRDIILLQSMEDRGQPKAAKRPRIDTTNAANSAEEAEQATPPGATCVDPPASPSPAPTRGATNNFCDLLTNELVARVLGFLGIRDVLRARVCRSLKAATRLVTVNEGLVAQSEPLASNLAKFGRDVLPKVEEITAVTGGRAVGYPSVIDFR